MSKNQTFHIVHAGMPKTASKTLTACLGNKFLKTAIYKKKFRNSGLEGF